MANTYTYLARSTDAPRRAAIFTLHGHRVSIEPATAPSYYQAGAGDMRRRGTLRRVRRMMPWMMPAGVSAMERVLHKDFRVADIMARAKGDGLSVWAWVRPAGLRLAPVMMNWRHVDNPEAARAFVEEVNRRRHQIGSRRGLPGPLDYWGSWLAGGLAAVSTAAWMVVRMREARMERRPAGIRGWLGRLGR
jgi:hypothetical protein